MGHDNNNEKKENKAEYSYLYGAEYIGADYAKPAEFTYGDYSSCSHYYDNNSQESGNSSNNSYGSAYGYGYYYSSNTVYGSYYNPSHYYNYGNETVTYYSDYAYSYANPVMYGSYNDSYLEYKTYGK